MIRALALVATLFVPVFYGATPGDAAPAGKFGAVQVVCDDAGVNHATPVPTTPLTDRNAVQVQNLDTVNDIYCGFGANVTTATGTRVPKNGGTLTLDIKFFSSRPSDGGQGVNPKVYCTIATCSGTAVNQTTPNDTRYLEAK